MKHNRKVIPSILALIAGSLTVAVIYLTFVFPKVLAIWEQEARVLTARQRLIAETGSFCTNFGRFILLVVVLGFTASAVWMLLVIIKKPQTTEI
jgi:type II secretory pathway component PulF